MLEISTPFGDLAGQYFHRKKTWPDHENTLLNAWRNAIYAQAVGCEVDDVVASSLMSCMTDYLDSNANVLSNAETMQAKEFFEDATAKLGSIVNLCFEAASCDIDDALEEFVERLKSNGECAMDH